MKKNHAISVAVGILLLGAGLYLYHAGAVPDISEGPVKPSSPQQAVHNRAIADHTPDRIEAAPKSREPQAEVYHPKDIEDIKRQIYDLNIETVEDIPLLDRVIQTGNAPVQEYWKGDWVSVDDNKEDKNGFYLQPQADGTFIYFPDENSTRTYTFFETPKTYTYDPVRREFSWQLDYYGKTITHRARFVNEDVLVTMLISGEKVTLDIYTRGTGVQRDISSTDY